MIEVLHNAHGKLSFGRCVAAWFTVVFSMYAIAALVMIVWSFAYGATPDRIAIVPLLNTPFATIASGSFLGALIPYAITKRADKKANP